MKSDNDCAFLVFHPGKERKTQHNFTFDGLGNFGAKVIADTLKRAGLKVGYTTPETAHNEKLVLISITGQTDYYSLLKHFLTLPTWKKGRREFKVLIGGFGVQNPTVIRDYIDWAAYGRAHEWVVGVVRDILAGNEPAHGSLQAMATFNDVSIYQGELYPFQCEGKAEAFTGCKLKCKFCNFSFTRKFNFVEGKQDLLIQNRNTNKEFWWDLIEIDKYNGRTVSAIDGLSERIRFLYGKRITNEHIKQGIENIGSFDEKPSLMRVFNIVNFPGEEYRDFQELKDTLSATKPKYKVLIQVHHNIFMPDICTPMQWEGINLGHEWFKMRGKDFVGNATLKAWHTETVNSPWYVLNEAITLRAKPGDEEAVKDILFSKNLHKVNAMSALEIFAKKYDVTKWTRELDIDTESPAPWLHTYIPDATIRKIAHKMRRERESWTTK
jgi:hypothetical protein